MKGFADRFKGRSAIITGGASGLGLSSARRILGEGGSVMLWDRNSDALKEAVAVLPDAHSDKVDVADPSSIRDAVEKAKDLLGPIDILINSAGITGATLPVQDLPIEEWLRTIQVNLTGVFLCCRSVLPAMLENGYGRIINVSSVAGKEGNPNASAYSASKAGVIALTRSIAKEVATKGVLANCITPTTFESPLLDQLPQSHIDYMRSKIPMGRFGNVEEVSAMVCFMASEECSYSTGATFDISGGRTTY